MTFPCDVDIKIFVRTADQMEDPIRQLLGQYLAASQIKSIRQRNSSKGKYQSLSCKVTVESKNEIDRVFRAIGSHPDVIMLL